MSTAAFSSNRMYEPSFPLVSFAVRTITAFATSPFLIWPVVMASLIVTTTMSPSPPERRFEPPSTRITSALRAPELSAIFSIVSCCTTVPPRPLARALDDFDHAPPLRLGERSRLHDPHGVAVLRTLVVVGRDLLGPDHLLAVEPTREAADQP